MVVCDVIEISARSRVRTLFHTFTCFSSLREAGLSAGKRAKIVWNCYFVVVVVRFRDSGIRGGGAYKRAPNT